MKEKNLKRWAKISSVFILLVSLWAFIIYPEIIIIFVIVMWNIILFPLHYLAWRIKD